MQFGMNTIERVLNRDEVIVAGHRGMRSLYPENTLLSIKEAIDAGVDMIETDLRLTKDKVVVLMHDDTVDRTTTGSGRVSDMTLEELRTLDAGGRMGKAYEGLKVPTLREFCELVDGCKELLFNIEIKERTEENADMSIAILKEFNMMERCVFTCFDAAVLAYIHDRYGAKCQGFPGEYMTNFEDGENGTYSKLFAVGISMQYSAARPDRRLLTRETVSYFESIGIEPWCYCPDDDAMVEEAIGCGARLMTCNNPLPALRILKARGMHSRSINVPAWPEQK